MSFIFKSPFEYIGSPKMNIDKFGHHVHKRLRLSELIDFKENSLVKSEDGSFDLHSSRLTGVGKPLKHDDAVNKQYVDEKISNLCTKTEIKNLVEAIKDDITDNFEQFEKKIYAKSSTEQKVLIKQNGQAPNSKRNP